MSTITAWRIAAKDHSKAKAFNGGGGLRYAARWNSAGTSIVYASGSLALATLEIYVRLGSSIRDKAHSSYRIQIPEDLVTSLSNYPPKWLGEDFHPGSQQAGDQWAGDNVSAVMKVPSSIVPLEYNFLLNPSHPDFQQLTIDDALDTWFDPRL